jgi:hypothetical protein
MVGKTVGQPAHRAGTLGSLSPGRRYRFFSQIGTRESARHGRDGICVDAEALLSGAVGEVGAHGVIATVHVDDLTGDTAGPVG